MTKQEIIQKVKSLNLPKNSYVVFGGAPLAVVGIREANDIDLLVTPEVLVQLKRRGWLELVKAPDDKPLTHDVFEAHDNWNFSGYKPTLEQLLATASIVDGVPFASLQEVRRWKAASSLHDPEKHNPDLALIDQYLENEAVA